MSVKQYKDKNGTNLWQVYLNLRSKQNPLVRIQKREKGFDSKSKALRRLKELEEQCYREILKKEGLAPTWSEVTQRWEITRRALGDIQTNTIDDYVSALRIWTSSIWDKPASEITKGDIRDILSCLISKGKSNSFQNKVLNGIRRVYGWGRDEGIIKGGLENLTQGIRVSRIEEKVPDILTLEEIRKLLEMAKLEGHPWYPIWAAAIYTGMRSGELYSLLWTDVDFTNGLITISKSYNKRLNIIKSTKAGYFRTVPMNDALRELLLELKACSSGEHVLPRLGKWQIGHQAKPLKLFCKEIGIREIKFHALRACFATHCFSAGISPAKVMKMCGWRELETMERYTRLAGV